MTCAVARAPNTCVPLVTTVVSQLIEYGDVVSSVPRLLPSRRNCTPTTPTLSDAAAVTLIVPDTVAPLAGAASETVGAVVSGGGVSVVALTIADWARVVSRRVVRATV